MSNNTEGISVIKELKDIFWAHQKDLITGDFLQKLHEKKEVFDVFMRLSARYYWGIVNMPLPTDCVVEPTNKASSSIKYLKENFRMMQFLLIESIIQGASESLYGEEKVKAMKKFWEYAKVDEKIRMADALGIGKSDSGVNIPLQSDPNYWRNRGSVSDEYWEIVSEFLYELRNVHHHAPQSAHLGLFPESDLKLGSIFSIKRKKGVYTCFTSLSFLEFQDIFEHNFLSHFINYANEK